MASKPLPVRAGRIFNSDTEYQEKIGTIVSAGIDWFTGTNSEYPAAFLKTSTKLFSEYENPVGFALHGYKGFAVEGASVGSKEGSQLVILRSGTAQKWWEAFFEDCTNVSRLDIQVTVRYDAGNHTFGNELYKDACFQKTVNANYPKIRLVKGGGEGDTFYCGSRSSDYFLRVYDKDAESGLLEYENCIRFELEIKGKSSFLIAQQLFEAKNVQQSVIGFIHGYMTKRGLFAGFEAKQSQVVEPPLTVKSNLDSNRRWLDRSVKPVCVRMCDLGLTQEVIILLGLEDYLEGGIDAAKLKTTAFDYSDDFII